MRNILVVDRFGAKQYNLVEWKYEETMLIIRDEMGLLAIHALPCRLEILR